MKFFTFGFMHSRKRVLSLIATIILIAAAPGFAVHAQDLDSSNFTLLDPSLTSPVSGDADSTNFSQLYDATWTAFTSSSTNYTNRGGFQVMLEPNIPTVSCFETDTNGGGTSCTGVPGSGGMHAVCSSEGCYDRAKIEINAQGNAADTRYAVQISTTSDFSSNVFYVDGTTRFLKSSLAIGDFVPKCEWEGTTSAGVCGSPNTTWQRYNILGLTPGTQYYVRLSAHKGTLGDAVFSQTAWSPSVNATTTDPAILVDVDIAPTTAGSSSAPYILSMGNISTDVVNTSSDLIIFRVTSNAINGVSTVIRGLNGGLKHTTLADIMTSADADLAAVSSGFGLRNSSATNSSNFSGTIGSINVSSTPNDFTDAGATHKVGGVGTSYTTLFTSGGAPLDTGVTGYLVKARPPGSIATGSYQELFTFVVFGTF